MEEEEGEDGEGETEAKKMRVSVNRPPPLLPPPPRFAFSVVEVDGKTVVSSAPCQYKHSNAICAYHNSNSNNNNSSDAFDDPFFFCGGGGGMLHLDASFTLSSRISPPPLSRKEGAPCAGLMMMMMNRYQ